MTTSTLSLGRARRPKLIAGLILALAIASSLLTPPCAPAQTPGDAEVWFDLRSITIRDEDDPLSNDEPYVVMVGFEIDSAGSVRARVLANGHGNLGRSGDNWADEAGTYALPRSIPRGFTSYLRAGRFGIAGAVIVHMEEDGFPPDTGAILGRRIGAQVGAALRSSDFRRFDRDAIRAALRRQIVRRLIRSLGSAHIGGIVRDVASIADPDDFGGVQVVAAVNTPAGLYSFAGEIPTGSDALLDSLRPLTPGCTSTPLSFPAGDLGEVPWPARFEGHHIYNARLCGTTFAGLF